ncbi:methyl-accepting chemotaxis protein [Candidatus Halobeggiatoa sp. HSG11]|nr:methyl-accepting chemotaxis protein [Candidatus Halobeggiatoa sp. HSG11]
MKINTKLSLAFLIIALLFVATGTIFIVNSHNALSKAAFTQLESVRTDKKIQIEEFFTERKHDMHILLDTVDIFRSNAFEKLQYIRETRKLQIEKSFQEHLHNISFFSHTLSMFEDFFKLDEAYNLDELDADEQKIKTELTYEVDEFKTEYGYHNILLVATNGNIIHSTQKQNHPSNLLDNGFKNNPLTKAFQQGLKQPTIQDFSIINNIPVFLISAPIYTSEDKIIGVSIVSVTFDAINTIIQKKIGITGEAYLVGNINEQTSYRSERLSKDKENVIGKEKIGDDVTQALAGQSDVKIKIGSTEQVEITSYAPLKIPNLNWAIIVTMNLEEYFGITRSGEDENFFYQYISEYNYQDLLLIHPQGKVFYTVAHEDDYKSNIVNGKYADSGLGEVVQEILKTKQFGITDYAPYIPSNGEPAAFIAQPLMIDNNIEMIVAVQLNDIAMNQIVQQKTGLGNSGEAYLVGSDNLMRSNSYHDKKSFSVKAAFANPKINKIENEIVNAALAGKTGVSIIPEYHDTDTLVLTAYTPISVSDKITWALLTEMDKDEAFAAVDKLKWLLIITALITLVVIISIAWLITHNIKSPLQHLIEVSNTISAGNLDGEIKITSKDEIGQLLQAFADMQTQLKEHLEKDISRVITSISQGNLEERLNLENKTGFFKIISENINQIIVLNQTMLEDIIQLLSGLAHGDLTKTIENDYSGTFGQLKHDANSTVAHLTKIMQQISHSSQIVANAADEISQGNLSLSQRTEQQAASLEETSASIEQMTSTVQQSADNASHASQLAMSARNCAEKGGEVVGITINAMAEINTSSKKITDIIEVINEIAFQTNLLALNAAVEAARAGEHGRGFAVVATEVRTLAQRSASAAKEIKELIQDSVDKAEEGTNLANKSGETLEEIVIAVKKVSDIIVEIAAASQEQSSGINQVNKAILQMDEMVQQNASLVEEAAAASEAMKEQAQNLRQQVAIFNINDSHVSHQVNNTSIEKQSDSHVKHNIEHHDHNDGWEDF